MREERHDIWLEEHGCLCRKAAVYMKFGMLLFVCFGRVCAGVTNWTEGREGREGRVS